MLNLHINTGMIGKVQKDKGLQSESNVKPTMGTLVTEGATPSSSTELSAETNLRRLGV